jgi:3-isopropylmalate/(R)-2-methylmalate dehydratase small subunit
VYRFDVDPALKDKLLKGLDDIAQTLQYESDIAAYEAVNR